MAKCHIILLYLLMLYTADTVTPLTTDDFYTDDSAPRKERNAGSGPGNFYDLPITINNIRDFTYGPATKIRQAKGYLNLENTPNGGPTSYNAIYTLANGLYSGGEAILKFSTDSNLLAKAHKDVNKIAGCVSAPTHLIISTNNNIKQASSVNGSTFQTVLATNGQYSYLIIQFVEIEPAVNGGNYDSKITYSSTAGDIPLPYASDKINAHINSNVGVPGKYVIDLNENPAPIVPCKQKMLQMTCKVLELRNEKLPELCSNFD